MILKNAFFMKYLVMTCTLYNHDLILLCFVMIINLVVVESLLHSMIKSLKNYHHQLICKLSVSDWIYPILLQCAYFIHLQTLLLATMRPCSLSIQCTHKLIIIILDNFNFQTKTASLSSHLPVSKQFFDLVFQSSSTRLVNLPTHNQGNIHVY